jgi:nucleoside-diphosphate-sugar epimerase
MTRVVVLGGSGFVGSAILAQLGHSGFQPVSATRHPRAPGAGIEQIVCDATDQRALMAVLQGARAVVNAVRGDADTMLAASRALATCLRTLEMRAVHISSMAVYGAARGCIDESAPLRGTGGYAEAKIACELLFAGTGAVILRPGIVYGPGGEQWAGRIFRLLRAGRLGDLGENGDGRCHFAHARDVGAAVVAALGCTDATGRAINVAHSLQPRWNDVLVACARAIGAIPVERIGGWRLGAEVNVLAPPLYLARLSASRIGMREAWLPDAITPSLRAVFRQDFTLDLRRAERLLRLACVPPEEGLAECAAWFLETYGLPRGAVL